MRSPIERWWVVEFLGDEEEALRRFASDPAVERVEPDYEVTISTVPNDPGFHLQWGLHNEDLRNQGTPGTDISAPEAWDLSTGDPSVVVAVLDTGVDYNHPDLAANIWANPGEIPGNGIDDDGNGYVDDFHGYFVGGNDPWDNNGHGTRVAGIVGAEGNNGVGVTGVAWRCRILPVKFLDEDGHGWTSAAIDAILYATATGAKVLNGSWTTTGYSQALQDAIATANDAGALFVTAAGNGSIYHNNDVVVTSPGVDIDATPQYPASHDLANVLTVTATDNTDNLAWFSDWGRYSVHLGAPGVGILSTSTSTSGYSTAEGTSLAAAHVSGAAALLFARFPGITHLQVKDRLIGGVDPVPALANRTLTGGRLAVFKAMQEDTTPPAPASDLAVTAVTARTVTLSWTATGDDDTTGRALRYELRYFIGAPPVPLDEQSFRSGALATGLPAPSDPWTPETFTVTGLGADTPYSFVLAVIDEVGNLSLSPVVPATTLLEEIVFGDDMEGGRGKWTVSGSDGAGLWHLSTHRSESPTTAFYYGRERGPQTLALTVAGIEGGRGSVCAVPQDQQQPSFGCDSLGTSPAPSCSQQYRVGTLVDVYAMPGPNDVFLGWSGACSHAGSCRVTMSQAQSVTASFRIANRPRAADAGGPCSGAEYVTTNPMVTLTSFTYNTGARNYGSIMSGPIDLSGRTGAWLSFQHFLRTENLAPYDNAKVSVSTDNGATWTDVYSSSLSTPGAGTIGAGADLSPFVGQAIQLRFSFDTLDDGLNDFEGWVVDDIVVNAAAVPQPEAPRQLPGSVTSGDHDSRSVRAPGGFVLQQRQPVRPAPDADGLLHSSDERPGKPVEQLDPRVTLTGWSGSLIMDDSEAVRSTRGPQPLTLSVSGIKGGRGTVSLSPQGITPLATCGNVVGTDRSCDFPYARDSEVDLYPSPEPLHLFVGWGGACSGVNPCHVRVSEAQNVTATFRGPETLTLTAIGVEGGRGGLSAIPQDEDVQGLACDNFDGSRSRDCPTQYRVDSLLNVSAAPAPHSKFLGWGGACQGVVGLTCRVTMSQAQSVTASFRGPSR